MRLLSISKSLGVNVVSELSPPVGLPSGACPMPHPAAAAAAASTAGGHLAAVDQLAPVTTLGFSDLLQLFGDAAAQGPTAAELDAVSPSLQDTEGAAASLFCYDALPHGVSLSLYVADSVAAAVCPLSLHDLAASPNAASATATDPVTLLSCSNSQPPVWPAPGARGCCGGTGLAWAADAQPWSVAREVAAAAAAVTAGATAAAGGAALGRQAPPGAEGAGTADTGRRASVLNAVVGSSSASGPAGVCILDVACAHRQLGAPWPPQRPPRQIGSLGQRDGRPQELGWQQFSNGAWVPLELLLPGAVQRGACTCLEQAGRADSCCCFSSLAATAAASGPQDPSVIHILLADDGSDGDDGGSVVSLQWCDLQDTRTCGGLLGTLDVQPQRRQLPQGEAVKPPGRSGCSRANRQEGASPEEQQQQLDVGPCGAVSPAVAGSLSAGLWRVQSTVLGCGSGISDSNSGSAPATEDACSCIDCSLWDRSSLPGADSRAPTTSQAQTRCRCLSDGRCIDLFVDPAGYGDVGMLGAGVKRLSSPATKLGQISEV